MEGRSKILLKLILGGLPYRRQKPILYEQLTDGDSRQRHEVEEGVHGQAAQQTNP